MWIGNKGFRSRRLSCFFLLRSWQSYWLCVCLCLWLLVSLTGMQQLLKQRRVNHMWQRHRLVRFTVPIGNATTSPSTFLWHPFDTTPSLTTPSLPAIAAPLLGSSSVLLSASSPASGLRRPASFIKRKQAGEITRYAGIWGQLICWQRHWGCQGASTEHKPEIYIVWGCLIDRDSSTVLTGGGLFFAAPLTLQTEKEKRQTEATIHRWKNRMKLNRKEYSTVFLCILKLPGRLQEKALTHGRQNPYHLTDQSSPAALLPAPSLIL